jgi:hypothetical protein
MKNTVVLLKSCLRRAECPGVGGAVGGGAMSKDIERQVEEQAKVWSGIAPPNAASLDFARGLAEAMQGFERARGQLVFEDEPSSFEAALQETKERAP